jgi:hypothetical protein
MKKRLLMLIGGGALVAALAIPTSAMASPIRECGNFVATSLSGPSAHPVYGGYWTYRTGWGPVIRNLTTREVSCGDARSAALTIMEVNRTYPWHGFRLRFTNIGSGVYDVRGVRGRQVIHWQSYELGD